MTTELLGALHASVDLQTLDHRLLVLAFIDTGTLLSYFGCKHFAEWRRRRTFRLDCTSRGSSALRRTDGISKFKFAQDD